MFAVNIFLKTLIFLSPRAHAATGPCLVISDKMIRTVRLHNIDH